MTLTLRLALAAASSRNGRFLLLYLSSSHKCELSWNYFSFQISCKKVRDSIKKSLSSECNGYTHHVVRDGLQPFHFQKKENEPLGPEYLGIMQCTISKLTYETLQTVASIVSHND